MGTRARLQLEAAHAAREWNLSTGTRVHGDAFAVTSAAPGRGKGDHGRCRLRRGDGLRFHRLS